MAVVVVDVVFFSPMMMKMVKVLISEVGCV